MLQKDGRLCKQTVSLMDSVVLILTELAAFSRCEPTRNEGWLTIDPATPAMLVRRRAQVSIKAQVSGFEIMTVRRVLALLVRGVLFAPAEALHRRSICPGPTK